MGTRQVIKCLIYGTLLGSFIWMIVLAFCNFLDEKVTQSSLNVPIWNMNMTMPSMTICPLSGDFSDVINAKDILDISEDFLPFNISVMYDGKK